MSNAATLLVFLVVLLVAARLFLRGARRLPIAPDNDDEMRDRP